MAWSAYKSLGTSSAILLLLILAGCASTSERPLTELVVDPATTGLPDEAVATVYWDYGVFAIDDLSEPANTRNSMFSNKFARLLPGEHHFFMDIYHNKSNYEFNWIFGDLEAGHRYRVERAETSGFLGGTTLWVIRDLTTGDLIAESVDCHETCGILDLLRQMHVQDRDMKTVSVEGEIELRVSSDFGERFLVPEKDRQHSLEIIETQISSALLQSGLPIVLQSQDSADVALTISDIELFHFAYWNGKFAAYGLKGDYQVFLSCEASLVSPDGVEIDRWLVAAIGESKRVSVLDLNFDETGDLALEKAAARLSARLVYDLQRRLFAIPMESVLSH